MLVFEGSTNACVLASIESGVCICALSSKVLLLSAEEEEETCLHYTCVGKSW